MACQTERMPVYTYAHTLSNTTLPAVCYGRTTTTRHSRVPAQKPVRSPITTALQILVRTVHLAAVSPGVGTPILLLALVVESVNLHARGEATAGEYAVTMTSGVMAACHSPAHYSTTL
jgi:hypothetical protein